MDALDCILGRRSIRRYTGEPITDEQVETLMRAAMAAPSAGNQQPWRFTITQDPAMLSRLAEVSPFGGMLAEAALGIVVLADLEAEHKHAGYWPQDCSAAVQNVLLAAHALGLGAVWIGVHPIPERVERITEILSIPDKIAPLCLISVGHPLEEKGPSERYDPDKITVISSEST